MRRVIWTALAAVGLSLSAHAGTDDHQPSVRAALVQKMHKANVVEMKLGGLAQRHGSLEVRSYGKMLTGDHMRADVELLDLASRLGLCMSADDAPAEARDDQRSSHMLEELAGLKGRKFDRTFLDMMVKDHDRDIAEVAEARRSMGDDDELGQLIDKQLPTLRRHQELARRDLSKLLPQARRPE